MKKQLTLLFTFISILSYSQSVTIISNIDEMENKTYLYPSRVILIANESLTIGFKIEPFIEIDSTFKTILVTSYNIGNCNENDELIILFDNGEKIRKVSWKKFNCKGESYFDFTKQEIIQLKTIKISKIRFTNGNTYDSYTGVVKDKDKSYFIELLSQLK